MSPTIARRRRYVTNFWMISPAMRVLSRKKSSANRSTGIRIRPAPCLDPLLHIAGDVANDRKAPPIRYEFLDDLAGNACVEPEEIVREPFHGNQDQTRSEEHRLNSSHRCISYA